MTNPLFNLESILQQLIVEHRKLLRNLDAQQNAMKTMALDQMDAAASQQEASRRRIAALDSRRRAIVQELARQNRIAGEISLSQIATLFPQRAGALTQLRDELKRVALEIQSRNHIAGKLAGAVLGH